MKKKQQKPRAHLQLAASTIRHLSRAELEPVQGGGGGGGGNSSAGEVVCTSHPD